TACPSDATTAPCACPRSLPDALPMSPAGRITRPDVRGWIVDMERAGTGAWTIHAAVRVLRAVLEAAVETRIIRTNPAAGVTLPRSEEHTSELQPRENLVCRLLLEKKK